ncbi:MAG: ParB N-terminal domain-containing protein [Hyphomicrobiaceae bacterium]|nr:ParB N-terminal domain-containing protein [Hyphomicrobiaceae bacterium]
MKSQIIDIGKIDTAGRLRPISRQWAATMAEQIEAGDLLPPIDVVERSDGYRLIAGGHRVEAHKIAGRATIAASVYEASEFADEAAIRMREIKENMVRFELTALDRAVHLATWKEIHETTFGTLKRGRRSKIDREKLLQDSAAFSASFSAVAADALRISERSIFQAVQIASGIAPDVRARISEAPIADIASELLQLAVQDDARQQQIVNLLLSEPPAAGSVADAIAVLDRVPPPLKLAGWEKVSDRFSRLTEQQQDRFLDAHADAVDRWQASRMAAK